MATWGVTASCALLALGVLSCSGGDAGSAATTTVRESTTTTASSTTTTAPSRPSSTTTTAYDPAVVEGQVEAAYLRSWDVYADAVYNLRLDESALAAVYAGEGLDNVREEIQGRIADRRAALVRVEHDYEIVMTNDSIASVVDRLVNHQVLIDPVTKSPIERDPNEPQLLNFAMQRFGDHWSVTLVQRLGQ